MRGQAVSKTSGAVDPAWLPGVRAVGGPGTFVERVIDRALKSLNLVVQSRVCTLVVIDLVDVPASALRRLPAATWFRIERAIEGSDTAVVIVARDSRRAQRRREVDRVEPDGVPSRRAVPSRQAMPSRQAAPPVRFCGKASTIGRADWVAFARAPRISAARSSQVRHVGFETALINAG